MAPTGVIPGVTTTITTTIDRGPRSVPDRPTTAPRTALNHPTTVHLTALDRPTGRPVRDLLHGRPADRSFHATPLWQALEVILNLNCRFAPSCGIHRQGIERGPGLHFLQKGVLV